MRIKGRLDSAASGRLTVTCRLERRFQVVVLIELRYLAVAKLIDMSDLDLDRNSTRLPDAPLPVRYDDVISSVDEIQRLGVVLAEGLKSVLEGLNHTVPTVVLALAGPRR